MLTHGYFEDASSSSILRLAIKPLLKPREDVGREVFTANCWENDHIDDALSVKGFKLGYFGIVNGNDARMIERSLEKVLEGFETTKVNNPVPFIKTESFKLHLNLKCVAMKLIAMRSCLPLTETTTQTYVMCVGLCAAVDDSWHLEIPS